MRKQVDLDKIAKGLGARRLGPQEAKGGYFGALQLVADVRARFKTPRGGGRPTDPAWTERRVVPLTEETLSRLDRLARTVAEAEDVHVEPMQVAALILERTLANLTDEDAGQIIRKREASGG
jgi:hypothetical protein